MGYQLHGYAPLPTPRADIADPGMVFAAYRRQRPAPPPPAPAWRGPSARTVLLVIVGVPLVLLGLVVLGLLVVVAATVSPLALAGVLVGFGALGLVGLLRAVGAIPPSRRGAVRRQ
ncbi:hypothetical protein [Micromonospora sp. NPDC005652]|uniref:hypothetical protein n=1 Tax=Micromonospora sp. NPDC005652 TaxID=3157046 RepID=UPI003409BF3B